MQTQEKGELNVPDVRKFWDTLKATWNSDSWCDRDCKWANLCLQQTSQAIGRRSLSLEALIGTGTARLAESPSINPFWNNIFKSLDKATFHYYSNIPSSWSWLFGEFITFGRDFGHISILWIFAIHNFLQFDFFCALKFWIQRPRHQLLGSRVLPPNQKQSHIGCIHMSFPFSPVQRHC